MSKHFAVLQSVDHTKTYKPLFRTVIDLETFDQLFGSKEKSEKVLNLVSERLDGLVTRWNALYSSDDPEVSLKTYLISISLKKKFFIEPRVSPKTYLIFPLTVCYFF